MRIKSNLLFGLLLLINMLFSQVAIGSVKPIFKPKQKLIPITVTVSNNAIRIKNTSAKKLNLHHAKLIFYYGVVLPQQMHLKPLTKICHHKARVAPHDMGYKYQFNLPTHLTSMMPNQRLTFSIKGMNAQHTLPNNFQLLTDVLVEVPVKVTVDAADWTQTINICNITANPIPLKDLEFQFNFVGDVGNSIWGDPWLEWKISQHAGNTYTLSGGTQWASDLPADPNCQNLMTIKFSSTPTTPIPEAPFVFKAAGAQPAGSGTVNVNMPSAPASNLPAPTVSIEGMGDSNEKIVNWGQTWKVEDVVAGKNSVSGSPVDNGTQFFIANDNSVNVEDNKTSNVALRYVAQPTCNVKIKLVDSPSAQQTILFAGNNYTYTKTVNDNSSVLLPGDSYTITSSTPGYSVAASPNPLVVPSNCALTLTYQTSARRSNFVSYFQSWSSRWSNDPQKSDLGQLPGYITHVLLSFAKPDAVYQKGSLNYAPVGLEFNYPDGKFLKAAIANLHKLHPQTKVILAVGGASYNNWSRLNPRALADFVADFGLDGIDIDYEAASPRCSKGSDGLIHCAIDSAYQSIVESLRRAIPRPYTLIATGWSIAAYGQGQWSNAQPQGDYTGMMLPFLRSPAAKDIDLLNVMSYDAGNTYDPVQALAAYTYYYPGPINMGVEVPPEAWGGHVYTLSQVHSLAQAVIKSANAHNTSPGMMLWSLQKTPNGTVSVNNPNAQMMASTICGDLGLGSCNEPLFKS